MLWDKCTVCVTEYSHNRSLTVTYGQNWRESYVFWILYFFQEKGKQLANWPKCKKTIVHDISSIQLNWKPSVLAAKLEQWFAKNDFQFISKKQDFESFIQCITHNLMRYSVFFCLLLITSERFSFESAVKIFYFTRN